MGSPVEATKYKCPKMGLACEGENRAKVTMVGVL